MKMQYFEMGESDKHLSDSAIVLQRLGDRIDRKYISEWADRLGLSDIWRTVQQRVKG